MFKWNKINKKWKWSLFPDTHLSNHTIPGSIDFLPMLAIGNQVKIDLFRTEALYYPSIQLEHGEKAFIVAVKTGKYISCLYKRLVCLKVMTLFYGFLKDDFSEQES